METVTVDSEEYKALRKIAKLAYDYAFIFYEGAELASPSMQLVRSRLMNCLKEMNDDLMEKFQEEIQ